MSNAASFQNPPITVLYATMSGNSMECALQVVKRLESEGHTARSVDLAYYKPEEVLAEQMVFICISTWGEGEPPDDAVDFLDYLKGLEAGALGSLAFSVFALGDFNYEFFCQCGKDVDALLEKLGARRLCERVDGDVDYDEEFATWLENLSRAVAAERATAA